MCQVDLFLEHNRIFTTTLASTSCPTVLYMFENQVWWSWNLCITWKKDQSMWFTLILVGCLAENVAICQKCRSVFKPHKPQECCSCIENWHGYVSFKTVLKTNFKSFLLLVGKFFEVFLWRAFSESFYMVDVFCIIRLSLSLCEGLLTFYWDN